MKLHSTCFFRESNFVAKCRTKYELKTIFFNNSVRRKWVRKSIRTFSLTKSWEWTMKIPTTKKIFEKCTEKIYWRSSIKTNSYSVRFFDCNLINYTSCGASCCREKKQNLLHKKQWEKIWELWQKWNIEHLYIIKIQRVEPKTFKNRNFYNFSIEESKKKHCNHQK